MPIITRSHYKRSAFILDESYIKKIYDSINTFLGNNNNIRIQVECKIDTNREFSNLHELINFENSSTNAIQSLTICGSNLDDNCSAYIKFDNEKLSENIHYSLDGEEQNVLYLQNTLEEYIDGIKPWYGFISRINFLYFFMGLIALFYIVLIAGISLGFIDNINHNLPKDKTLTSAIIESWVPYMPLLVSGLLYLFRKKIFPLGQFAIGQGKKRNNDGEYIRKGVVVTLILSIIASIIEKLIFV